MTTSKTYIAIYERDDEDVWSVKIRGIVGCQTYVAWLNAPAWPNNTLPKPSRRSLSSASAGAMRQSYWGFHISASNSLSTQTDAVTTCEQWSGQWRWLEPFDRGDSIDGRVE